MAFDISALTNEITTFSTALENYLKAEADYASDSTKVVPEFASFFTSFLYQNLSSAAFVNAGNQATLIIGSIMNEVYRIFSVEREFDHVKKTKADYYNNASSQFSTDKEYETLYTVESLKYLTGTSPYQGGRNNG